MSRCPRALGSQAPLAESGVYIYFGTSKIGSKPVACFALAPPAHPYPTVRYDNPGVNPTEVEDPIVSS